MIIGLIGVMFLIFGLESMNGFVFFDYGCTPYNNFVDFIQLCCLCFRLYNNFSRFSACGANFRVS